MAGVVCYCICVLTFFFLSYHPGRTGQYGQKLSRSFQDLLCPESGLFLFLEWVLCPVTYHKLIHYAFLICALLNMNCFHVQPPEIWDGGVGFVSKEMIQAHCPAPAADIQVNPYCSSTEKYFPELGSHHFCSVEKSQHGAVSPSRCWDAGLPPWTKPWLRTWTSLATRRRCSSSSKQRWARIIIGDRHGSSGMVSDRLLTLGIQDCMIN